MSDSTFHADKSTEFIDDDSTEINDIVSTVFMDSPSVSYKPRKSAFICLPGSWSGDMWHCAAATALCQSDVQDIITVYPVTIIGLQEGFVESKGYFKESTSIKLGSNTFNYFRNIGIPILLCRLNRLEAKFDPMFFLSINKAYMDMMIQNNKKFNRATCQQVWDQTAETSLKLVTTPRNPSKYSLKEFSRPPTDKLFKPFSLDDEPMEVIPPYGYEGEDTQVNGEPHSLYVWASTTIVMQYLKKSEPGKWIPYLQNVLGQCNEKDKQWCKDAMALMQQLSEMIDKLGQGKRKAVLFNYRIGDVNRQGDSNIDLLNHVKSLAEKKDLVVIPVMVNVPEEEYAKVVAAKYTVLDFYKQNVTYDKRYSAAFWAYVANHLSDKVFGLVGGRSGSMDIAALMGVNCISWDEPVLNLKAPYKKDYVIHQGGQLLRMLSQRPCTSVVYVDPKGMTTKKRHEDSIAQWNVYQKLDEVGFNLWLDRRDSKAPTVVPNLTRAQVLQRLDELQIFRRDIKTWLERLGFETIGVKLGEDELGIE